MRYAGDPGWFYGLSREQQVQVDAYHRATSSKAKAADEFATWHGR